MFLAVTSTLLFSPPRVLDYPRSSLKLHIVQRVTFSSIDSKLWNQQIGKAMSSTSILIAFLILCASVLGFAPRLGHRALGMRSLCMGSYANTLKEAAPSDAKATLKLTVQGPSINSAIFRADMKKELTFFRGCAANFQLNRKGDEGVLLAEGKTSNLLKFLDWLHTLELPQSERKPNFQGPSVQIVIASGVWQPFSSKLTGFNAGQTPPLEGAHLMDAGEMEGASMAGTDESV